MAVSMQEQWRSVRMVARASEGLAARNVIEEFRTECFVRCHLPNLPIYRSGVDLRPRHSGSDADWRLETLRCQPTCSVYHMSTTSVGIRWR